MTSSSKGDEVCPSGPKIERVMTMVIFFLSPVEGLGGDHGISSKEEKVCPSSPKKERSITMVTFLLFFNRALCGRSWHIF